MTKKNKFTVKDSRGAAKVDLEKKIVAPEVVVVEIPEAPVYSEINIKMCGGRILLQDFPNSDKVGSIFIPNVGDLAVNKARVVGIGPEVKERKVGDIVYKIADQGQTLTTSKGEKYIFLPENACIAVDTDFVVKPMVVTQDDNL